MRRALVAVALLAACKSAPVPSSYGINVTVDASALPSATRSQITTAALSVSGDETYSRTFDIRSAIASGQVRFRYIPGITSGSVTLALDALSSDGSIVARAPSATVMLLAGHAVATTMVLAGAALDDMGSSSDDAGDGGTCNTGFHECGGTCVDDRSIDNCGTSCTPCPVTANATAATCDGTTCGLQCNSGFHVCSAACVSSSSASSCNMSCTPCTPPTGGTATCDGTSCGGSCPSNQKLCFGTCIPSSMACNGSCPSGTHECNGNCFDDTSVNSCGTSCTPCPVPANATAATCSGGQCGFTCNAGYKQCGSGCIPMTGCCMSSDCAQPANGVATCDTSTNTCVVACNGGFTKCGSACISTTACCMNTDCPQPTNGMGICNSAHMCTATCNSPYNAVCNNACVDTTSDNNNCGGCAVHCAGQCTLSRCVVVLASGQKSPGPLASDGTNVYWGDAGDALAGNGSIMSVPVSGGTPATLASSLVSPSGLVIDANNVYWSANGTFGSGSANKIAKTGGSVTQLATNQYDPFDIAVDASNVYFTNGGYMTTMGNLNKVPIGGGSLTTLGSVKSANSLAVAGSSVYWTDGNGNMLRTPVNGGTSVQIATGSIQWVTTDGTNLYWSDYTSATDGTVKQMALNDTTPTTLASSQKYPTHLAVDNTNVYWITFDTSTNLSAIVRVPIGGGQVTTIVPSLTAPHYVALDATSIYWSSPDSIYKASPK